jgi:hypothetical protein
MDSIPFPLQDHPPYEKEVDLQKDSRREEDPWNEFLRHQICGIAICRFHENHLWHEDRSEVGSQQKRQVSTESGEDDSYLCNLSSKASDTIVIRYLSSRRSVDSSTAGKYRTRPFAVIETQVMKHLNQSRILRVTCPGGDRIQGQKSRVVSATCVDYDLASSWLKKRRLYHEKACSQPPEAAIIGLKVIDCYTRDITEAPEYGCQCVTLSHVWVAMDT